MSANEIEKNSGKMEKRDDDLNDYLGGLALLALIGGGLFAYWAATSPKAKTFIGGGLAATGAKMIKDNWNK